MLYSKYKNRIERRLSFLALLKRFRVWIISSLLLLFATVATLLSLKGVVFSTTPFPGDISYGETISASANTFLSPVVVEYRAKGTDQAWSTEPPRFIGEYEMRIGTKKAFGISNYTQPHTFTITQKATPIHIPEGSVIYGEAPAYTVELLPGDSIDAIDFVFTDITKSSTAVRADLASIRIRSSDGKDVTGQYLFEAPETTLTIEKRAVSFSVSDVKHIYDANAVFATEFTLTQGSLVSGDVPRLFTEPLIDANEGVEGADVIHADFSIQNAEGVDVTHQYSINVGTGRIVIEKRHIRLQTLSQSWVYDGQTHNYSTGFEIVSKTGLASGHIAKAAAGFATIQNVGTVTNTLSLQILDETGNDVTKNYVIEAEYGTLCVTKRPICITTATASFLYNGTAHVADTYTLDGGSLADAHAATPIDPARIETVGTLSNTFRLQILDGTATDVSENYDIAYTYGTLTVTPREIALMTESATWVYDGVAHDHKNGFALTGNGLATGHIAQPIEGYTVVRAVTAPFVDNVIKVQILDAKGEDVSANYTITYSENYGKLTVTPREITLTTESATWVYDGVAHDHKNGFTLTGDGLAAGHAAQPIEGYTVVRAVTAPFVDNVIKVQILDAEGEDVSANYAITYSENYGKLTVTPRKITLTTKSATWVYDGVAHDHKNGFALTGDGLAAGHIAQPIEGYTTITEVTEGALDNKIPIRILDAKGEDVSANYAITYNENYGKLTVTPREVTVKTDSAQKVYDGTALTKGDFTVSPEGLLPVAGHEFCLYFTGTQTDAGESQNTVDKAATRILTGTQDVTANYAITYVYGTLTVTPREVTLKTDSAQKVYDGTALTKGDFTVFSEGLPFALVTGHELLPHFTGTQTDAGESQNTVDKTATRILTGTQDVTANYAITYVYGTLTVTPRKVTVTTESKSWVYDGEAHDHKIGFSIAPATPLANGQTAKIAAFPTIRDVAKTANDLVLQILDAAAIDRTANYEITYVYGTLTVTPREVTLKTDSAQKVYDGTPLTEGGFTVSPAAGLPFALVTGHEFCLYFTGTQTDAGESQNTVDKTATRILAGAKDVTANYEITYEYGTLTVTPRKVTVTTESKSWVYDGEAHDHKNGFSIAPATPLANGQTARIAAFSTIRDVAKTANDLVLQILDAAAIDRTANYEITYVYGTLTVTPRPVTVTTASAQKIYDGTPLTEGGFTVSPAAGLPFALVTGHEIYLHFTGAQTDAGESQNTVDKTATRIIAGTQDVTANYEITYEYGTLTVTPRPITATTDSAQKVYDGTPLTEGSFTVSPAAGLPFALVAGHEIYLHFTGTQTDVGESQNTVDKTATRIIAGSQDVTANYEITYEYGTLTVTPRPITVTTDSAQKVYDSTPLTEGSFTVSPAAGLPFALVAGHEIYLHFTGTQTDVGESQNTVDKDAARIMAGTRDVTANYEITYEYGTLSVTPIIIRYSTQSAQKVFDGTPLTAGFTWNSSAVLSIHKMSVSLTASLLFPGKITNDGIEYFVTTKADGRAVNKENYLFLAEELGDLTVTPRKITVRTGSAQKIYDGKRLTENTYQITTGSLCTGHRLDGVFTTAAIDVGEYENEVLLSIMAGTKDMTAGYEITLDPGTLTITPRPITVKTDSSQKPYDGSPLTAKDWKASTHLTGTLASGQAILTTFTGSQLDVGSSENSATVKITDADGEDTTQNYAIIYTFGTLTVTEPPEPPEPRLMFKVLATTTGRIYFRTQSHGNYAGPGSAWLSGKPYTGYIQSDGVNYPMTYLVSALAKATGISPEHVKVEIVDPGTGPLLPYYTTLSPNGYSLPKDDVYSAVQSGNTYEMDFYTTKAIEALLNASATTSFSAEEQAYRQHVYDNYLSLDAQTRAYMNELIEKEGFSTSDPQVISRVASYIQNAATYNLQFNRLLELEPNMPVAFLETYKDGLCRHYAASATMLFRALGFPARYTVGFVADAVAGKWVEVDSKYAHAWVEVYLDGIGWIMVEVTGSDNNDGEDGGGDHNEPSGGDNLPESALATIILTPVRVRKTYDGTPLYAKNAVFESQLIQDLRHDGYRLDVTVEGERTEVGISASHITNWRIYDALGNDVSSQFLVITQEGEIEVLSKDTIILRLQLYEISGIYGDDDNNKYFPEDYFLLGNDLPSGYTLDFKLAGTQSEAGVYNTDLLYRLPFKVFDENGKDVSEKFALEFVGKGITVAKRVIKIRTADSTAVYKNGIELSAAEAEVVFGGLLSGHRLSITGYYTLSKIGTISNVLLFVILDKDGNDVTHNYDFEQEGEVIFGQLTLLAPPDETDG